MFSFHYYLDLWAAWLAIIGFAAVMVNFGVVNVFSKGVHSYSGL
ncbi:hypothetical protein [Cryobacterium sp. Y57]